MKNRISFYLLYGMLVLFGGLGVLLLIFGEKAPHPSQSENRMLAGFPALSASSIGDGSFMTGVEDFLSDNMIDRDGIIEQTDRLLNRFSFREETDPAAELYQEIEAQAQETVEPTAAPTLMPAPIAAETPVPQDGEPTPAPTGAVTPEPNAGQKDLSAVPDCIYTYTEANGAVKRMYTFPSQNVRRMIELLNAYRAVLPEDGHVFFAQPPFPEPAYYLREGRYIAWGGDLEDVITEYSDEGVYAVSVQRILEQPIRDGEYMYFRTDHHWTPRAANLVASCFIRELGIDPKPYGNYSFHTITDFYGSLSRNNPGYTTTHRPDTADIMIPSTPVRGYQVLWSGEEREAPLITDDHSYMAFLGGTIGPWRRFETGVDCGRNCLVIGDSFSNVFVPFLTPYYETIHTMDPRKDNYDPGSAQWKISEYIAENEIDDVYFILSTATGVNTVELIKAIRQYL